MISQHWSEPQGRSSEVEDTTDGDIGRASSAQNMVIKLQLRDDNDRRTVNESKMPEGKIKGKLRNTAFEVSTS